MDKSRPWPVALKSPIIQRNDLQPAPQRIGYGALTVVLWALWLYLWLPLLAVLAWALGAQQAYKYMIVLGGYQEVARLFVLYTLIIAVLGGSLIGWATYNIIRFSGTDNRDANRTITPVEIARAFGMDPIAVEHWQNCKYLQLTHDRKGNITCVETSLEAGRIPA